MKTFALLILILSVAYASDLPDFVVHATMSGKVVLDQTTSALVDTKVSNNDINAALASRMGLPWSGHSTVVEKRAAGCLVFWVSGLKAPEAAKKLTTPTHPLRATENSVNVADIVAQQGGFVAVGGDMRWSLLQLGVHPYFAKDNTGVRMSLRDHAWSASANPLEWESVGTTGLSLPLRQFDTINNSPFASRFSTFNYDKAQTTLTVDNVAFDVANEADATFVADVAFALNLRSAVERDVGARSSKVFLGITLSSLETLINHYGPYAEKVKVAQRVVSQLIAFVESEISSVVQGDLAKLTIFTEPKSQLPSKDSILAIVDRASIKTSLAGEFLEVYETHMPQAIAVDVCTDLKEELVHFTISCLQKSALGVSSHAAFMERAQVLETSLAATNETDFEEVAEAQIAIWGAVMLVAATLISLYMLVYMEFKKDTLIYGQDPLQQREQF